jgi:hypothetical protein
VGERSDVLIIFCEERPPVYHEVKSSNTESSCTLEPESYINNECLNIMADLFLSVLRIEGLMIVHSSLLECCIRTSNQRSKPESRNRADLSGNSYSIDMEFRSSNRVEVDCIGSISLSNKTGCVCEVGTKI